MCEREEAPTDQQIQRYEGTPRELKRAMIEPRESSERDRERESLGKRRELKQQKRYLRELRELQECYKTTT